jgi:hypothetical protein
MTSARHAFETAISGHLAGFDPDGDTLIYSLVDDTATGGTVTSFNASTGAFTFTPEADYYGIGSVGDQVGVGTQSDTAPVFIHVDGTGGTGGFSVSASPTRRRRRDTPRPLRLPLRAWLAGPGGFIEQRSAA